MDGKVPRVGHQGASSLGEAPRPAEPREGHAVCGGRQVRAPSRRRRAGDDGAARGEGDGVGLADDDAANDVTPHFVATVSTTDGDRRRFEARHAGVADGHRLDDRSRCRYRGGRCQRHPDRGAADLRATGPTTDAVPAFDEPTDHTEEILSRTVEVPATVHDWSRVMPPEEPTLSEEVLDETYLAPATAEASEEPAVAEEVLAETPPEVLPEEALVATAAVASLTPQILDEPDVAPETAEAPEEAQEPTVTEEVLAEAAPRVEADEAPVTTAEAPSLTEEALEETEPERAAGVVARGAEADEPKPEPEPDDADRPGRARQSPATPPAAAGPGGRRRRRRPRDRRRRGGVAMKSGGGSSAAQEVAGAASATLGQQYAQVNIATNVPKGQDAVAGVVTGFTGNGTFDFATSQGVVDVERAEQRRAGDPRGRRLDDVPPTGLHRGPAGAGQAVGLADGRRSRGGTPSGFAVAPTLFVQLVGGPTTMLQQLKATGVTAHKTGSLIYQGTPVDEYAVRLCPTRSPCGRATSRPRCRASWRPGRRRTCT